MDGCIACRTIHEIGFYSKRHKMRKNIITTRKIKDSLDLDDLRGLSAYFDGLNYDDYGSPELKSMVAESLNNRIGELAS